MNKVYVLHENDDWTAPLLDALTRANLPFEDWHLNRGAIDLATPPPPGVFYNRMSASSHTRGHRYAPEYAACVLEWLAFHGRTVVNGRNALALEVSKSAQYCALEAAGIRSPRTVVAVDDDSLVRLAANFTGAFITKHNRAGRGKGVQLFQSTDELKTHLADQDLERSPDGITVLQEFIAAPDQRITRAELVGGKFYYAVSVSTKGGFELCPCDTGACAIDIRPEFEVIDDFEDPLIAQFEAFAASHRLGVVAFEFIRDADGNAYTYDVNTNTNYNSEAEQAAGVNAMDKLAQYLGQLS